MAAEKDQEEIFQHFDTSLGCAKQKSDKPYFAGPANEEEFKKYK